MTQIISASYDPRVSGLPGNVGEIIQVAGGATAWVKSGTGVTDWDPFPGGAATTGLISGGTSGTSLAAAIAVANAAGGGYTIQLGKGTYRLTAQQVISALGITIVGNGPGSTFLEIDDAGGMAGADAFLVDSVLWFEIKGLTFTATTARTAGAMVKVLGANNITATPAQRTNQYTIEDVDAEDQFNGLVLNDGPGSAGAWGGFVNRCEWLRFSAGGTYVDVNSPSGGQHYISNLKIYGSNTLANAQRALAGIRYRGGADLEMSNVNEVYLRSGFLWDPPNGQAANVVTAMGCLWDNNTLASIKIAPAAGGTVLGGDFVDGWGYTPVANTQPCVQIDGGSRFKFIGGQYWGNYQAFRVSGPAKHVLVQGADCSGSVAGLYANLNATDFAFLNNIVGIQGATPTVGIQIDAGCDHYTVTGNNVREATTPITNTPGTSAGRRIVQDNIVA
jgi:hypothetical protein